MEDGQIVDKRGMLKENFRFVRLKDRRAQEVEYHYHDFDKIVILLNGDVSYMIEGKRYFLKPWDILLVRHNDIHRPFIDDKEDYERIVLWIDCGYLAELDEDFMGQCFDKASERGFCLYRPHTDEIVQLKALLEELEVACRMDGFGKTLRREVAFARFMLWVNQLMLYEKESDGEIRYESDEKIEESLKYINSNLIQPLTVDDLAKRQYISKYHFMRRFKEVTGYTVHNYILQKRVLLALEMMEQGKNATEAAMEAGFQEYSSFSRACKKILGKSPKNFKQ